MKNFLLASGLTLAFVLAAAAVLEFLPERWLRPSFDMDGYTIVFDRRILYRLAGSRRGDINRNGYRAQEFSRDRHGKKRILFLGDSVTMGSNVTADKTAPAVLGRLLGDGFEVLNMGIFGYGPDQSLIELLDDGLALDPDGVILGINPSNDYNDIGKNRLLIVDGKGKVQWSAQNVVASSIPHSRFSQLLDFARFRTGHDGGKYRMIFETLLGDGYDWMLLMDPRTNYSHVKLSIMSAVLQRFHEELRARKIPFLVVIYPTYEAFQGQRVFVALGQPLTKRFLLENLTVGLCETEKIPYLNLYPLFENAKPEYRIFEDSNGHPGVEGYHAIAAYLADYLRSSTAEKTGWNLF